MTIARRQFLARTGLAVAGAVASSPAWAEAPAETIALPESKNLSEGDWEKVRAQFALSDEFVHMSALLLSSHPKPVRDVIETYRRELDANPVLYLRRNEHRLRSAALSAAGRYFGADPSDIALTDSTTMGVGLVYNALRLDPGQEILSTEQDYYVTQEAIRLAAERSGATVRKISLHDRVDGVTEDRVVERIVDAITPATRVLAVTWVHSSTGLKLPLRRIADALEKINAERDESARVLFCVDGVHGFGNQDVVFSDLGCDFFMAGCHKWLFGPRGTGIVVGSKRGWDALLPIIPSFTDDRAWQAWLSGGELSRTTNARSMTPGGYKPFEHVWALTAAFEFVQAIGKPRIAARTRDLAAQLKEGLAAMPHVTLHTPRAENLSAGIVSFDVAGMSPEAAVRRLRERSIIASVAPYAVPHVRLTPSIQNTPGQIDTALSEVRALAS